MAAIMYAMAYGRYAGNRFSTDRIYSGAVKPKACILDSDAIKLAIEANNSGHILDLSGRGVDDKNILRLIDVLSNCKNITTLRLVNNNITDLGVRRLSIILVNSKITHVDLSKNSFGDIGARCLLNSARNKITLVVVTVDENQIGEKIHQQLNDQLDFNGKVSAEIETEKAKSSGYQDITCLSVCLPKEMLALISDYYNESRSREARTYFNANCLPKILSWNASDLLKPVDGKTHKSVMRANSQKSEAAKTTSSSGMSIFDSCTIA